MERKYLTHKELSTYLHITPTLLKKMRSEQGLPYTKPTARKYLYALDEVTNWLTKYQHNAD